MVRQPEGQIAAGKLGGGPFPGNYGTKKIIARVFGYEVNDMLKISPSAPAQSRNSRQLKPTTKYFIALSKNLATDFTDLHGLPRNISENP